MFRFTIRDLLWLMLVVAVATGWWTSNRAKDQNYASELLKAEKKAERDMADILYPFTIEARYDSDKVLGVPQPKPLPPEFGETPN